MKRSADETEEEWEARTLTQLMGEVRLLDLSLSAYLTVAACVLTQIRPAIHQAAAYSFNKQHDLHKPEEAWRPG